MKKGSSKLLLLDVNVLLALAWPNHPFHEAALRRLETSRDRWATCAITQLGFVRLSSTPAVVGVAKSPAEAASLLVALVSDPLHSYLDTLPAPVAGEFIGTFDQLMGAKQVTDAYLVFLARKHDAILLTFDTRLKNIPGADSATEIMLANP